MKDDPEIVKILKLEEKLGKLRSQSQNDLDQLQASAVLSEAVANGAAAFMLHEKQEKTPEIDFEERYQIIFENYAVAITLADDHERIFSWNKYAEELLHMSEKDLFMKPVSSLYPIEEWERIRKENVRRKGIKYKMETKMICKDKGVIDVELSLCILRGAEGKTVGSIGIIRDISKLKKTERKLKESEERYRTIFENSAVAITLTDDQERIISWNDFTEDLLNMGKNDLQLIPVKNLYPPEEWKKIRSHNIQSALSTRF